MRHKPLPRPASILVDAISPPYRLREFAGLTIDHLLARGVLEPRDVFARELTFETLPGRNRLVAIRGLAQDLIVKESAPRLQGAVLSREGDFYVSLADAPEALRAITCALVDFDHEAGRLALQDLGVGCSGWVRLRSGAPDPEELRAIGEALAVLHRLQAPGAALSRPAIRPLYFSFGADASDLRPRTPHAQDYALALSRHALPAQLLSKVHASLSGNVPIHGDLRLANLFLRPGAKVVLLDWETSGLDDPQIDLGHIIGSIAHAHLRSGSSASARRIFTTASFLLDGYGASGTAVTTGAVWAAAALALLQFGYEDAQTAAGVSKEEPAFNLAGAIAAIGEG